MRYWGQYVERGHYMCPEAYESFITKSYYTDDPEAFIFNIEPGHSGDGSFDHMYTGWSMIMTCAASPETASPRS